MRKIIIVLLSIGILVSWQIWDSDLANAGEGSHRCSPAGLWKSKLDSGSEGLVSFTPLDPTGKRFVGIGENYTYDDSTFGGYFPEDTKAGKTYFYSERISPGIHEGSFYQFGVSESAGGPVWKLEARGITEMIDCDHGRGAYVMRIYVPNIVDGEIKWVDVGICEEFTSHSERITLAPPCGGIPPLPDF
jgi:hypothetical protein